MNGGFLRTGFVYLIQESGTNYFKIGKAYDIQRRMRDLKTGNPRKLVLISKIECPKPYQVEAQLFRKFSHYRIDDSEWFDLCPIAFNTVIETFSRLNRSFGTCAA